MNDIRILLVLFTLFCATGKAQSVEGKWRTYDVQDPSRAEAVVELFVKNNALYVRIDQIIPKEHRQDICSLCEGEDKNKAILGLLILKGAKYSKGVWKGATILNAKNGKRYGCHISLISKDRLKVRGFIRHPWFGKNFYWDRVD